MTSNTAAASLSEISTGPRLGGLRVFSKILCTLVLALLFVGATVKSHEAGLSVPDWPTSYGYSMFTFPMSQWIGGIFYEHVHRLLASAVGFLTLVLAVWTWYVDSRRSVRWLTGAAVLAVIAQGVLGGLTVIYKLPLWISTMHGTLGQIFFCLTIAIAYLNSETYFKTELLPPAARPKIFRAAVIFLVILFCQLIFGNLMRHSDAALAVPDFPTMAGSYVPDISAATISKLNIARNALHLPPAGRLQVAFHLLHRMWAIIVMCGFGALGVVFFRSIESVRNRQRSYIGTIFILLIVQLLLGVLVILSLRMPLVASLHLVTGALLLATTLLLAMNSARA